MKTIPFASSISIPREIAVCPYCGAGLYCQPTAWGEQDDGTLAAIESGLECCAEPDIDSEEWDDWLAHHCNMPYVHWLPVDLKVLDWLRANYRFVEERSNP